MEPLGPGTHARAIRVLAFAGVVAGVSCGASMTTPSHTLSYISINGSTVFVSVGQAVQMTATAGYADGTTQVVTAQASWQSSNPSVVTVSSGGFAVAVAGGSATLRATYGGMTGSLPLNISGTPLPDCILYNTAGLQIVQEPDDWLLTDGHEAMYTLDNPVDAANALALAQRYSVNCFIGRENTRANRLAYIVDYWQNPTGAATTISPEDCQAYSAGNLQIVNLGANGWALMDGARQILLLDNQGDANAALALAKQYSSLCFIGRANTRPNPLDYIVQYWK